MSDEALEIIRRKVLHNNKHVLWCYAPGLFRDSECSEERVQDLTGFRLRFSWDGPLVAPRVTLTGAFEETVGKIGTLNEDLGPAMSLIEVTDSEADRLGFLAGTDKVVFARKHMKDWVSFYSITSCLDPSVYRALAKSAGVHIYNAKDDTFYANNSYITLHANGAGHRTIQFPGKCKTLDVISGEILCDFDTGFTRYFANGETLIALYEKIPSNR